MLRASRRASRQLSQLPAAWLPADVDAATGLCASGAVRIGESPGRGLGAYAARALPAHLELGVYQGEVLHGVSAYHARYGEIADADAEWHHAWATERRLRGVGTTGQYVFAVGSCPRTSRYLYVDAEDPERSNWTRFLNHCDAEPNLRARKSVSEEGVPTVRFSVMSRPVARGEELTFDYGPNYGQWLRRHAPRTHEWDGWQSWGM